MTRTATWELKRQIAFTETIKRNTITKHEAKLASFDQKIQDLKVQLADATVAEAQK